MSLRKNKTKEKMPTPGFEPGLLPRKGSVIGRATLHGQYAKWARGEFHMTRMSYFEPLATGFLRSRSYKTSALNQTELRAHSFAKVKK